MMEKITFVRKAILSALPGIAAQQTTTIMDPVTKTVYDTIKIGVTNNIYDKLFNDEDKTTIVYKTSWLLDSVASGHYADKKTMVRDKKKIQPGTGIEVECADKGIINQIGEGKLPVDNVLEGTKEVNIFHDMHSPLLSGGKFVKEGKYTLVFGRKNSFENWFFLTRCASNLKND